MNFTEIDLFLIEMAIDEVMWKLPPDNPNYKKFDLLNQKVRGYRLVMEHMNGEDS
jgi:hypothetical protein